MGQVHTSRLVLLLTCERSPRKRLELLRYAQRFSSGRQSNSSKCACNSSIFARAGMILLFWSCLTNHRNVNPAIDCFLISLRKKLRRHSPPCFIVNRFARPCSFHLPS